MIETCYFNCPQKGKMLSIFFDDEKEINHEFIKKFINDDKIDRYIELIYRKGKDQYIEGLIKGELDNKRIFDGIMDSLIRGKNIEEIDIIY